MGRVRTTVNADVSFFAFLLSAKRSIFFALAAARRSRTVEMV